MLNGSSLSILKSSLWTKHLISNRVFILCGILLLVIGMLDLIIWVQAVALVLPIRVISTVKVLGPLELVFALLGSNYFSLIEIRGLISNDVIIIDVYNNITLVLSSDSRARYAITDSCGAIVHLVDTFKRAILIMSIVSLLAYCVIIGNHVRVISNSSICLVILIRNRLTHNLLEIKSAFQTC